MRRSFNEIYKSVEVQNSELSYQDYLIVLDALEWKSKDNTLTESLDTEIDLEFYVEALISHKHIINEWTVIDFTSAVEKTKAKAIQVGNQILSNAISIIDKFKVAYSVTYEAFLQLGISLQLGIDEVFNTLRERGIWEAVKSVKGLAIHSISNLYSLYTTAYKETSALIFGNINKTMIGDMLRNGTIKIQDLVEKNPKLKYVVGPIIAYTLYYIWTKMVFKGDFLYDFDWSTNLKALTGDVDVVNIFSGEAGVELLVWFGLGLSGMFPSAAWLDGELETLFAGWGNHALAVLATIMIYLHDKHPKLFDRPLIKAIKDKLCVRDQKMSLKKHSIEHLEDFAVKKGVFKSVNGPKCVMV